MHLSPLSPLSAVSAGCEYAVSADSLGADWDVLDAWARAPINPSRNGPAVSEGTWLNVWRPHCRRLLGYAREMGMGATPLAELLADGQLFFEYALFLTEHRRARRRRRTRPGPKALRPCSAPGKNQEGRPLSGARTRPPASARRKVAHATADAAMRTLAAVSELLYTACGIEETNSEMAATWRGLLVRLRPPFLRPDGGAAAQGGGECLRAPEAGAAASAAIRARSCGHGREGWGTRREQQGGVMRPPRIHPAVSSVSKCRRRAERRAEPIRPLLSPRSKRTSSGCPSSSST